MPQLHEESPPPPEARRRREGFSPEPPESVWPCQHLDFGISGLQIGETINSCCLTSPSRATLLQPTGGWAQVMRSAVRWCRTGGKTGERLPGRGCLPQLRLLCGQEPEERD